jgi:hypothetical protein
MFTVRHGAVLFTVFALSVTGSSAQDNIPGALVTNYSEAAVAKHRLTVENVRKLFAVERELLQAMQNIPDLDTRVTQFGTQIDPHRRMNSIELEIKVGEGIPEIAQILQRHRMTAREYVLTKQVATAAATSDEAQQGELLQRGDNAEIAQFIKANQALTFWRAMDPALRAEADEWKKARQLMAARQERD